MLQYGAGARLAGAAVSTYLLEKTRVNPNPNPYPYP